VNSRVSDEDTAPAELLRAFGGLTQPKVVPVLDFAAVSTAAPHHDHNEDAWGHRGRTAFAVADGMGGRAGADLAASAAVATLLDEIDQEAPVDWPGVIEHANAAVVEAAARWGLGSIGSTFVAVRCRGGRVTIAHAGDSRIYRIRNGVAAALTEDHSVRGELEAAGIRPATVNATPQQLAGLTCFLGDTDSWHKYSVRNLACEPGDRLVLCTDGIHRTLHPSVWASAARASSTSAMANELVDAAVSSGSNDDATALVIRFAATWELDA